jgi:hypothetical protein
MCKAHYMRWWRYGDPLGEPTGPTTSDRLMAKIATQADDCWLWTGCVGDGGYGQVTIAQRRHKAHRAVYELLVGPIPEGLDLDHLCRVRRCVNPDHLEPVTRSENLRRGHLGKLTHGQRAEIAARRSSGELASTLADEFGITTARVYQLAKAA